jgi:hypothetical protein
MDKRNFETHASSAAESENSALKRSSLGPKPFHSLFISGKAQTELNDRRNLAKKSDAAVEVDMSTVNDPLLAALDDITTWQAKAMVQDYKSAAWYSLYRLDDVTFYVRQMKYHGKQGNYSDANLSDFVNYMVPQFARTRIVSVIETINTDEKDPVYQLICSCKKFRRLAWPCGHIWKVLAREPQTADTSVRFHKQYYNQYLGMYNNIPFLYHSICFCFLHFCMLRWIPRT